MKRLKSRLNCHWIVNSGGGGNSKIKKCAVIGALAERFQLANQLLLWMTRRLFLFRECDGHAVWLPEHVHWHAEFRGGFEDEFRVAGPAFDFLTEVSPLFVEA
jgi:hypothetical protein